MYIVRFNADAEKELITFIAILTVVCFVSIACTNRGSAKGESNSAESENTGLIEFTVIPKPSEVSFLKNIIAHHKDQKIVFYCWDPRSVYCLESNSNVLRFLQKQMGNRDDLAYVNIAMASEKDTVWINNKDTLRGEHYAVDKELYQTVRAALSQEQPSPISLEFSLAVIMAEDGGIRWKAAQVINNLDCFKMQEELMTNDKGSQAVNPSALVGTKWEEQSPDYEEFNKGIKNTIEFKKDVLIEASYRHSFESPYIISSQSQRSNGPIKTKKTKGCFINHYNDKQDRTDYYVIVSFTPDKLILFHPYIPGTIGGGNWMGVYKRIK